MECPWWTGLEQGQTNNMPHRIPNEQPLLEHTRTPRRLPIRPWTLDENTMLNKDICRECTNKRNALGYDIPAWDKWSEIHWRDYKVVECFVGDFFEIDCPPNIECEYKLEHLMKTQCWTSQSVSSVKINVLPSRMTKYIYGEPLMSKTGMTVVSNASLVSSSIMP